MAQARNMSMGIVAYNIRNIRIYMGKNILSKVSFFIEILSFS